MKRFPMRRLHVAALVLSAVSGVALSAPAHAQFGGIVYDPSNYAQNVMTAARSQCSMPPISWSRTCMPRSRH